MKKQTKLSLNKFKIAKISKFELGGIVGGEKGTDDTGTRSKEGVKKSTGDVDINTDCLKQAI